MTISLSDALKSASIQCGNVIYNCEQQPADNERHLSSWRSVKEFIDAALVSAPDQPESLTGCLHPIGPLSCQNQGKCQSASCSHYNKTECRPRMTVLAQVDGILYPPKETM